MERWHGKVAVITGASAGIGAAIAKRLLEEGLIVVGLARRKQKVEQLRNEVKREDAKLHALAVDVTREEEILQAFKWIKENVGPVHVLVNSAGIARLTRLIGGDTKMWREVMDTNFMSICISTREAIKSMQENNVNGHVIVINSIGGHKVVNAVGSNILPSSKYAVTAYVEALRNELTHIGSKIKITDLSPGVVDTEVFEATAIGSGLTEVPEMLKNFAKNMPSLEGKDIADAAVYVLSTPPHVQISTMIIKPVGETL